VQFEQCPAFASQVTPLGAPETQNEPSQQAVVGFAASQHPPPTSGMPARQAMDALPHILKARSV